MEELVANHKTKCRLCLQKIKAHRNSVEINEDIERNFFTLTNSKLVLTPKYSSTACKPCIADLTKSLKIQQKMINNQQTLYQLENEFSAVKFEKPDDVTSVEVKTECFDFGSLVTQTWMDSSKEETNIDNESHVIPQAPTKAKDLSSDSDDYFADNNSESIGDLFVCQICNKALASDEELSKHLKTHEKNEKSETKAVAAKTRVVCHFCGQVLSSVTITYHIQTHENKINNTPLRCDLCSFECFNRGNIKIHMKKSHLKDAPRFKCSMCPREFSLKWPRTHHERTFHCKEYGKYNCDLCRTKFDTPTGLKNHQRSIHLTGRFQCKYCKVVIFNKGEYNLHVRKHRKKISCEVCGVKVIIGDPYTKHMSTHGHPEFKCPETGCKQKFYSTTALEKHIKADHGPQKTVPCPQCGALFHTELHLKRHVTRQHAEPSFFCEIVDCNYSTVRKEYLVMHLNNHKHIATSYRDELLARLKHRS